MSVPEQAKMARVEALSTPRIPAALSIQNEFLGNSGKRACGVLSYRCCPDSESEFSAPYKSHPELLQSTGIVVQEGTDQVIGTVKLSGYGRPRGFFDKCMHTLEEGEFYIEWMAVTENARGQGAGKQLLEWSEAHARAQGGKRLTLGVVNGNPARRLYERFGFVEVKTGSCKNVLTNTTICCLFGMPHGECGGVMMAKPLA